MIALERTVKVPADRRLHLNLKLPRGVPEGDVRVALTFSAPEKSRPAAAAAVFPSLEALKAEARRKTAARLADPDKDSMRKYAGCLAGSRAFAGDPVEIQRRMRDE